jgi:hypothetical protein
MKDRQHRNDAQLTRRAARTGLVALAAWSLGGCAIGVPVGEPVYEPPAVVAEPEVSAWVWWPWPHYDVEHRYVVEDDHVIIHDRHYTPFYRRTQPYIRNDKGRHKGWYKHGG